MSNITGIHVFGVGAIGSNLFIQLLRQNPDLDFFLYDMDKVEARNIPIQAFFLEHINKPKVLAAQAVSLRYLNKPKVHTKNMELKIPLAINSAIQVLDTHLVLDCFDNSKARALLAGQKPIKNTLHLGFSPQFVAECVWDENYSIPGELGQGAPDFCQMHGALLFIHNFVNQAALNITEFIRTGERKSFIYTSRKTTWL